LLRNRTKIMRDEYLLYVNIILPKLDSDYPVRENHCWARIILDHVCGCAWRDVVEAPAYLNLSQIQLRKAIDTAKAIIGDPRYAHQLNQQSLRYRGKASAIAALSSKRSLIWPICAWSAFVLIRHPLEQNDSLGSTYTIAHERIMIRCA